MAIYRPPSRRWPAVSAAGFAGIVIGLIVGALLFGSDDPVAAGRTIRAEMLRAAGSLEVAAIEYGEASASDSDQEFGGADDALASARSTWGDIRPALAAVTPGLADDIDARLEAVASLMEERAPAEDVLPELRELADLLKGAGPGS